MSAVLAAFAAGLVFGLGLVVSGMTNPAKVIGFLDLFGDWDPSLALVMGAALAVTAIGYRLVWRRARPLAGTGFQLPASRRLDARLAGGAALFGIGWGLLGLCPGPAVAALASGEGVVLVFLLAMALGMALHRLWSTLAARLAARAGADGGARGAAP